MTKHYNTTSIKYILLVQEAQVFVIILKTFFFTNDITKVMCKVYVIT